MFFRLKLALRLRDCLSRPYGDRPEKYQPQRASVTCFTSTGPDSRSGRSDRKNIRAAGNKGQQAKKSNTTAATVAAGATAAPTAAAAAGSSSPSPNARSRQQSHPHPHAHVHVQEECSHNEEENGSGKEQVAVRRGECLLGEGKNSLEDARTKLTLLAEDLASENESLKEEAVKCCYEISIENSVVRPLFLELGLVQSLLKLARTRKRESRKFSSLTLACLTSHEECREFLLKRNILRLCFEQLDEEEHSDDVKGAWLRAIGRLAKFSEATKEILELNGLRIIINVLKAGSDGIKRRALIALYFIGADKPSVQESFIQAGAIKPLLDLCVSKNLAVQLEAIDVCKVLSRCRSCADLFVKESGIRRFVEAASEGATKEIKNSAYRVLQRLCAHGPEISQSIVKEGTSIAGCDLSEDGVEKLIDVFSTGVISLQEEAAKIVEELCETDPVASNELSQPSIVKSLITLLSSASPDGVAYAVNSLSHMLSDRDVKAKVMKEEGAIKALLATLVHGSERAADGAAASLEKLSSYREVAEQFVSQDCVSIFLKAMDERGDRVQLPISRILFYSKAVKSCFLQNLISCGGAQVLVHRCWRGVPQVKVLCASLLADLCLEEAHMEQVVASGGVCVFLKYERQERDNFLLSNSYIIIPTIVLLFVDKLRVCCFQCRHGIPELKECCNLALTRLQSNPKMAERVLQEKGIQTQLTATLAMLDRDHKNELAPNIEEAIRMVPRHFFAPQSEKKAALSGKKITFQKPILELPVLEIHVQMLEVLQLRKGQSFLELGCGSGYLLALAKYLIGHSDVVGIDGDLSATNFARSALERLNEERGNLDLSPTVCRKPIPDFFSTAQRFDRIVVSVSFPKTLVGALRLLLKSNGRMVVPVDGRLLLIDKESGIHGARVLCEYHPLKILKQTYHNTRELGGVVVIDPTRPIDDCDITTNTPTETRQSLLMSRIPRPESRASLLSQSQAQGSSGGAGGRSRIPGPHAPASTSNRCQRVQRESNGRTADRDQNREPSASSSTHRRRNGQNQLLVAAGVEAAAQVTQKLSLNVHAQQQRRQKQQDPTKRGSNSTAVVEANESLTNRLRRECAPYQMSMTDVKISRRPNGKKHRLGEGGFGTVYKAIMNDVDEVAVKIVRRQDPSEEDLQSFLKEIKVLSSLRHRNIVQFYGACVNPPSIFFVTEIMKGGDLYTALRNHKDILRSELQLWWEKFGKKVALDVALGLNYLHSQKPPMMHRDLKTPNVLLSEEGNAKIADVGMVRTQDKERVTAQRIMTPLWAAPEVMRKERTSIKADVWSYGVLIWEIASGEDIIEFQPLAISYMSNTSSKATSAAATDASKGRQIAMPDTVPELARRIFSECTKLNPDDRPEMKDIVQLLRRG